MFKLTSTCIAALILLQTPYCAAQAAPAAAVVDQSLAARIDAGIAPYFKADEPGVTVIVTKDGKTVFRKAYGMANMAKHVPLTPDTVLRLGSITKQFTSTAILMLAEEGKLSVSDEIGKYLPGYPTNGKKITIEHLLNHTSGIVSYTSKRSFIENLGKDMTVAEMIDSFKNDPLDFEPGSKWKYNNSGYFLLGAIIEKVSGMPYARFVEQRIFVPLGMNNTAYEGFDRGTAPKAAGYTASGKQFGPNLVVSMTQPYAAGALVSTVDDMARWDAAVSSGKLLKAASWQQAFTPAVIPGGAPTNYGYGWQLGTLRGVPTVYHGGSINGFKTFAMRVPSEHVYVAVLSNSDSGLMTPDVIAEKAAAHAIGKPFPQFAAIQLDPKALEAFTGAYKINDKETRIFRVDGGKLIMQRSGRSSLEVLPYSAKGVFIPKLHDYFEFERDATGAVTGLTQYSGDTVNVQPRVGPVPADPQIVKVAPALLDGYIGRYQVTPQMVIAISRDGDRLYGQAQGQPAFELFPMSDTLFFVREVDAQVRFGKADDGSPQLVLSQNGRNMPGKKLN